MDNINMLEKIRRNKSVGIILAILVSIVSISALFNGLFALVKIANTETIEIFFSLAQAPVYLMIAYKLFNSKYSLNIFDPLRCKWVGFLFFLMGFEIFLNVYFQQQGLTFFVVIQLLSYLYLSYSPFKELFINNKKDVANT